MEKFSAGLLERHFQMIYLDQRGVGRSGSPADGNFSLARMVLDFEEVRAALGIPHWLTLGHSFGLVGFKELLHLSLWVGGLGMEWRSRMALRLAIRAS